MGIAKAYKHFKHRIETATDLAELDKVMAEVTKAIGFDFYAIGHHVDWGDGEKEAVRLYNYPEEWVEFYDGHHLGGLDPVHRAASRTDEAFLWSKAAEYIEFSSRDHSHMQLAEQHGLGQGFTVPTHVPGEFQGSCSFAATQGRVLREDSLLLARLIAPDAFKAAKALIGYRGIAAHLRGPGLTPRQRECLTWVAAGKTDWEIGQIVGIKERSVRKHVEDAMKRLGAVRRPQAVSLAQLGGMIS